MGIIRALRDTQRQHWAESSRWLMFTLIGSLIPVWGGAVLTLLYSGHPSIDDYTNHGEFALYSASLLAPALYIVLKESNRKVIKSSQIFIFAIVLLLLLSVLVFAGVGTPGRVGVKLDIVFLRNISILLYLIAIIISFLISVLDNRTVFKNLREVQKAEYDNFEAAFDSMES